MYKYFLPTAVVNVSSGKKIYGRYTVKVINTKINIEEIAS